MKYELLRCGGNMHCLMHMVDKLDKRRPSENADEVYSLMANAINHFT
jgi:hypothetical protein